MTLPRPIIPGTTYLITRRCTQRQFLLRPCKQINQIFLYCLGVAAKRHNILIHSFCVMSNHWHAVATDPDGKLPKFLEFVHKYTAKAINVHLGRWENLWSIEQPSLVRLVSDDDVFAKMIYTQTNPVAAGLVRKAKQWPGLCSTAKQWLEKPIQVKRPKIFFRKNGQMPENIKIELTRPQCQMNLSDKAYVSQVNHAQHQREITLQKEHRERGLGFCGKEKVLSQRPTDSPRTKEVRRQLKPRVAAANRWRRVEVLQRLKSFLIEYRDAWNRWKMGKRNVLFPAGTYALRIHCGVICSVHD